MQRLYCHTQRIHTEIRGEDVATVMLTTTAGAALLCELTYAGTPLERECFPQTLIFIEGDRGSVELSQDYWVRTTTAEGTHVQRCAPPRYAWADPAYDVVHASIVPCARNLLEGLQGMAVAKMTAEDNLRTLELVFGAYESTASGRLHSLRSTSSQSSALGLGGASHR